MKPTALIASLMFVLISFSGCVKKMPPIDLSQLNSTYLDSCKKAGAIMIMDERYENYWAKSYDNTKAITLGQMGELTSARTLPNPVRRKLIRIFNEAGAKNATEFEVVHYRDKAPPVDVHVWRSNGTLVDLQARISGTESFVNWPCSSRLPRLTRFRIPQLKPGDTVEIIHPLSGPNQEYWKFGSPTMCVLNSKVVFGHSHDTTNIDLSAVTFDRTGSITRTSGQGEHPVVFELSSPLLPMPAEELPVLVRSARCRGWDYLRGGLFSTPLWLARSGSITGSGMVPKELTEPVKDNQIAMRLGQLAVWLKDVHVKTKPVPYWMQWLPREPVDKVALKNGGSPGGVAALVFRILEMAELKPRFGLVHLEAAYPFMKKWAAPIQFTSLAVVVNDETGKIHWIVPGQPFDPAQPIPTALLGRQAIIMERWVADRYKGGGACKPDLELLYSCNNTTREPLCVKSVKIGQPAN